MLTPTSPSSSKLKRNTRNYSDDLRLGLQNWRITHTLLHYHIENDHNKKMGKNGGLKPWRLSQ